MTDAVRRSVAVSSELATLLPELPRTCVTACWEEGGRIAGWRALALRGRPLPRCVLRTRSRRRWFGRAFRRLARGVLAGSPSLGKQRSVVRRPSLFRPEKGGQQPSQYLIIPERAERSQRHTHWHAQETSSLCRFVCEETSNLRANQPIQLVRHHGGLRVVRYCPPSRGNVLAETRLLPQADCCCLRPCSLSYHVTNL